MILGTIIGGAVAAVALNDDLRRTHERAIRTALQMSGSTMRLAAQEAEIDQAQFTRQIQLLEGTHKRLAMQPLEFWRWYALLLAQEFGLPKEVRRSARLALALMGRKRAAKSSIAVSKDRRSA